MGEIDKSKVELVVRQSPAVLTDLILEAEVSARLGALNKHRLMKPPQTE
jgi:hypothetical protein